MQKSLKKIALATGFTGIALLSLSTASWSMGHHGGGMNQDPGRIMAHVADRLDLSEEQRAEVKEILDASREATDADRQRLQELRRQLREQQADFDESETRAAADEIGQITSRLVFQATRTHARIHDLLTPEQREEMQRMMQKREERRGKWRREGGKQGE